MSRLERFKALEKDAWYGKLYKKLSKEDLSYCLEFLENSEHLQADLFTIKVRAIYYKRTSKNAFLIEEMLSTVRELK